MTSRPAVAALLTIAAVFVVLPTTAASAARPTASTPASVERVLIVSLPEISWQDLADADLPALDAFTRRAALANVATRIGRAPATLTDAYLTMGAGTRAVSKDLGTIFDTDEAYGDALAGDVFRRRTGQSSDARVLNLDVAEIARVNDVTDYGAKPGALGDALGASRVTAGVVGNADLGLETTAELRYRRPAGSTLMNETGEVPLGAVSAERLLRNDPTAPFGVLLDEQKVLDAFDAAWSGTGRRAVLVEASDLSRAEAYAPTATGAEAARHRRDALERSDALVAALLQVVDPERDAVMIIAPVARDADADLAAVALAAPGIAPGLLDSATTRRTGFVQLADVAPTVLDLFGLDVPTAMEGRPFRRTSTGGSYDDRVSFLVDSAREAEVRDRAIPYATTILGVSVLGLALAYLLRSRIPASVRNALPTVAIAVLALVPATYASALASVQNGIGLVISVLVPATLLTIVLEVLRRRHPFRAVAAALAIIVGLLAIDLLSGARLQLNTLFGYSTAVAGRFAGLGNLAFGFLAAATLLLAVTAFEGIPGRRGLHVAIAILVAGVLLDGLPMLGGDVGGVLAMVPAFGLTAMVLAGRRVRPRHVIAWCAAGAATVLAFGLIDFARPRDERTHLARFLERVNDHGVDEVSRLLERRWEASFGGARTAALLLLAIAGALVVEYVFWRVSARRGPRVARAGRAVIVGLVLLGVIGLLANDSGVAVPGVMLAVAVPVAVLRSDGWRVAGPEAGPA